MSAVRIQVLPGDADFGFTILVSPEQTIAGLMEEIKMRHTEVGADLQLASKLPENGRPYKIINNHSFFCQAHMKVGQLFGNDDIVRVIAPAGTASATGTSTAPTAMAAGSTSGSLELQPTESVVLPGEKKRKAAAKPKDPEKPKRGESAYFKFRKEKMAEARDVEGGPSGKELTTQVTEEWKSLPDAQKQKYNDMAKEEMAAYHVKMKEYETSGKKQEWEKRQLDIAGDPPVIKKPRKQRTKPSAPNPFHQFCKKQREQMTDRPSSERSTQALSGIWKNLSDAEKDFYKLPAPVPEPPTLHGNEATATATKSQAADAGAPPAGALGDSTTDTPSSSKGNIKELKKIVKAKNLGPAPDDATLQAIMDEYNSQTAGPKMDLAWIKKKTKKIQDKQNK